MTKLKYFAILAILAMLLAACVPVPASPPPAQAPAQPAATAPVSEADIVDIVWQWMSVTDQTTKETKIRAEPGGLHDRLQRRRHADGQSRLQHLRRRLFAGERLHHQAGPLHDGVLRRGVARCGLPPVAEQRGRGRAGWRGQSGAGNSRWRTANAVQKRRRAAGRGAERTFGGHDPAAAGQHRHPGFALLVAGQPGSGDALRRQPAARTDGHARAHRDQLRRDRSGGQAARRPGHVHHPGDRLRADVGSGGQLVCHR